jgi:hypothetical protein
LPLHYTSIGCTTKEKNEITSLQKGTKKEKPKKLNCNQEKEELLR